MLLLRPQRESLHFLEADSLQQAEDGDYCTAPLTQLRFEGCRLLHVSTLLPDEHLMLMPAPFVYERK